MPRYKHVSKKSRRRRLRKFESSFSYSIAKTAVLFTMSFTNFGKALTKMTDSLARAFGVPPRYLVGADPAAPNGDKTALVVTSKTDAGQITVEGVYAFDTPDKQNDIISLKADRLSSDEIRARVNSVSSEVANEVRTNGLTPRPDQQIISEPRRAGKTTRALIPDTVQWLYNAWQEGRTIHGRVIERITRYQTGLYYVKFTDTDESLAYFGGTTLDPIGSPIFIGYKVNCPKCGEFHEGEPDRRYGFYDRPMLGDRAWREVHTCPKCGTRYEFINGD